MRYVTHVLSERALDRHTAGDNELDEETLKLRHKAHRRVGEREYLVGKRIYLIRPKFHFKGSFDFFRKTSTPFCNSMYESVANFTLSIRERTAIYKVYVYLFHLPV